MQGIIDAKVARSRRIRQGSKSGTGDNGNVDKKASSQEDHGHHDHEHGSCTHKEGPAQKGTSPTANSSDSILALGSVVDVRIQGQDEMRRATVVGVQNCGATVKKTLIGCPGFGLDNGGGGSGSEKESDDSGVDNTELFYDVLYDSGKVECGMERSRLRHGVVLAPFGDRTVARYGKSQGKLMLKVRSLVGVVCGTSLLLFC